MSQIGFSVEFHASSNTGEGLTLRGGYTITNGSCVEIEAVQETQSAWFVNLERAGPRNSCLPAS